MRAYISVSFGIRKSLDKELKAIMDVLNSFDIEPFIFVDHYRFDPAEEQLMMRWAMTDIDRCDFLIAEASGKAIGIGIEAGYAKAKNKPVIYMRPKDAEHSTTLSGISDFRIIYNDHDEIPELLTRIIGQIVISRS